MGRLCIILTLLPLGMRSAEALRHQKVSADVSVHIGSMIGTTAKTFLAHGWEPWTATAEFEYFDNPVFVTAMSHLRGSTIRFGGISADWLAYSKNSTVAAQCKWSDGMPFTTEGKACPFTTGSFDYLLDFLVAIGVDLLFNVNEIVGRTCTNPGPKPWNPEEWCGDHPAAWDTSSVRVLLQHVRDRGLEGLVGFELGNELFKPPHISPETAHNDLAVFAGLVQDIWQDLWQDTGTRPKLFASGTNDCDSRDNSDTMATLLANGLDGFSFHSYPGNFLEQKRNLTAFVLNSTWLRHGTLGPTSRCLDAWNAAPRAQGLAVFVTEGAAASGSPAPGTPGTDAFVHGFFSIAQLGQFARAGVAMVARWAVTRLVQRHGSGLQATWEAAADFFLYKLYQQTVGPGVLSVAGDDASDALVYAHCAASSYGTNGTVTIFAANPSALAITLEVAGMSSVPRIEYVLTAPNNDVASSTPILNGNTASPLRLGTDGSLPPLPGNFCTSNVDCSKMLTLPPLSQTFFVLLGADHEACKQENILE